MRQKYCLTFSVKLKFMKNMIGFKNDHWVASVVSKHSESIYIATKRFDLGQHHLHLFKHVRLLQLYRIRSAERRRVGQTEQVTDGLSKIFTFFYKRRRWEWLYSIPL